MSELVLGTQTSIPAVDFKVDYDLVLSSPWPLLAVLQEPLEAGLQTQLDCRFYNGPITGLWHL